MTVEIQTTLDLHRSGHRISVIVNGEAHSVEVVIDDGMTANVRNELCEQWSEIADEVTANEIPRIPTRRYKHDEL